MAHFSNYSSKSKVFLSALALSGAGVGLVSLTAAARRQQRIEPITSSVSTKNNSESTNIGSSAGLRNANTQLYASSSSNGGGKEGDDSSSWPFHLDETAVDVDSETQFDPARETPAYWKFHLTGSETSAQPFWQNCLGLVYLQESQDVVEQGNDIPQVVSHEPPQGMDILESTSLNYLSTVFFGSNTKARFFTLLRHPVDRLVSLYYHLEVRAARDT
jgi:hypothetical protein